MTTFKNKHVLVSFTICGKALSPISAAFQCQYLRNFSEPTVVYDYVQLLSWNKYGTEQKLTTCASVLCLNSCACVGVTNVVLQPSILVPMNDLTD